MAGSRHRSRADDAAGSGRTCPRPAGSPSLSARSIRFPRQPRVRCNRQRRADPAARGRSGGGNGIHVPARSGPGGPPLPGGAGPDGPPRPEAAPGPATPGRHAHSVRGRGTAVITHHPRSDEYTALSDRMGYLLILRLAMAAFTIAWAAIRPEALGTAFTTLAAVTATYVAISVAAEIVRRNMRRGIMVMSLA